MKPGIANLSKWAEKTGEAIKRICEKKEGFPVGFALCFYNPMGTEGEQWNFTIELAYDPDNPPSEDDRKRLRMALEHIMQGVAQIYQADEVEDMSNYTAQGTFH